MGLLLVPLNFGIGNTGKATGKQRNSPLGVIVNGDDDSGGVIYARHSASRPDCHRVSDVSRWAADSANRRQSGAYQRFLKIGKFELWANVSAIAGANAKPDLTPLHQ